MNLGSLTRRIIVTAIAAAGVLASAAPAIAKAIELREVPIRGPELSRPLVLSGNTVWFRAQEILIRSRLRDRSRLSLPARPGG